MTTWGLHLACTQIDPRRFSKLDIFDPKTKAISLPKNQTCNDRTSLELSKFEQKSHHLKTASTAPPPNRLSN